MAQCKTRATSDALVDSDRLGSHRRWLFRSNFALLEAVRQLQGCAAAQLETVRTSLVLGAGGMFSAAGAVVLRAG